MKKINDQINSFGKRQKNIRASILITTLLCFLFLIQANGDATQKSYKQERSNHNPTFIHATYIAGDKLKKDQLKHMRLEQFNFIYAFKGGPAWWEVDNFNMPEDDIMNKLVHKHSFPTGDSGLALIPELIALAHKKNIKILVSVPARKTFNPIAADSKKRALFARVMAAYVKKYDFDGIEIDWEGTVNIDHHIMLMADLRQALDKLKKSDSISPRKYYLTTALAFYRRYSRKRAQDLSRYIDWVNVMTYDMGGGRWGKVPTHNTPLDIMKKRLWNRWKEFSPDKICIGLASYGFFYSGIMPGQKCGNLRAEKKARYFSYTELSALLAKGWTESYDPVAEAPYYFSPDKKDFVTIDNNRSHSRKLEWVFEKKYRGVFWWEFQYDYYPPAAGKNKASHPLMDHVSNIIEKKHKLFNR